MRLLMINKNSMSATQIDGVTNISASGNVYTITITGGGTGTYSKDDYYISILWI